MSFSLVVAHDKNRVIGRNGTMPWALPADMEMFVKRTLHHTVLMGRKTWQGLRRQPLPNRHNIVLSRNPRFTAPQAEVVNTLEKISAEFCDQGECMVIGGNEIYRAFLPLANRIYLTLIETEVPGDTWFPKLDPAQWHEVSHFTIPISERNPFLLRHLTLERRINGTQT